MKKMYCARTDGRKDYENSRKSMQLYLNSLMGTGEMEVLRSLSNPEEMDDAELLKDLRGLGKPPSFDGKDTMLINTAVDTRETTGDIQTSRRDTRMTPYEKIRGQKYRKEILSLGEQVLARRPGARMNEHHRAIREMDNQVNQHIEMPQIQHTDKVADDSVVKQRQISPRTTETKAPEHQWDDRPGGDSRIEIPTLTKDQKASHIALKKETSLRTIPRTATQVSHLVSAKRH